MRKRAIKDEGDESCESVPFSSLHNNAGHVNLFSDVQHGVNQSN